MLSRWWESPISKTALLTAASRARETARYDRLFADHLAAALAGVQGGPLLDSGSVALGMGENPFLPIRTRWFDDRVGHAVDEANIRQVVILACGLDSRAFRLSWPSETVLFELDHPDLISFKERVLETVGAGGSACRRETVGADLAGAWRDNLTAKGFRESEPTLWLLEGILVYLPPERASSLLTEILTMSKDGSRLVCDVMTETFSRSPWTQDYLELLADQDTPWKFFTDEPSTVLAASGWSVEVVDQPGTMTAHYGRWPYPLKMGVDDLKPSPNRAEPESWDQLVSQRTVAYLVEATPAQQETQVPAVQGGS